MLTVSQWAHPQTCHKRACKTQASKAEQGDWVVLIAEPWHICGVDVAAPDQLHFQPHLPLLQRVLSLPDCFSDGEVRARLACSAGVDAASSTPSASLTARGGRCWRAMAAPGRQAVTQAAAR